MTWKVVFMSFLCGLFGGSLFQNLFFGALALTSATFVTAIYNLVLGITFVLAITFGFEKLKLGEAAGRAKVVGTFYDYEISPSASPSPRCDFEVDGAFASYLFCLHLYLIKAIDIPISIIEHMLRTLIGIGGAMVLTFVKGMQISIWPFHVKLLKNNNPSSSYQHSHSSNKGLLGVVCAIASSFSYAFYLIIQSKMNKEYPSHNSSTALMLTAAAAIQVTVFAFCTERDLSQWKLGCNIRLLASPFSCDWSSDDSVWSIRAFMGCHLKSSSHKRIKLYKLLLGPRHLS
ncbi:hypothetical protein PIB30_025955 [Stylosanthes scabra]|uniref:WAT1-related protein n=1 Tax=Stylosanthes scabra TaxID=79078 RepID=A0ABU6RAK7_9FABA|nr:hypothetical protein [Stylosanthes scabra]